MAPPPAQAAPTTNVDLPPILPKQTLAKFQSDIHRAVHMEEENGENRRGKPLLLFARADPGSILNGEPHTWVWWTFGGSSDCAFGIILGIFLDV